MTSVAEALRRHAPQYLRTLADTKANIAVRKAFEAIMRCRTGELGGVQWQCDGCGRTHWVGRSCGNRHCSTCGADKTNHWLAKQSSKLLIGVHHFLVTFVVDIEAVDDGRSVVAYLAPYVHGASKIRLEEVRILVWMTLGWTSRKRHRSMRCCIPQAKRVGKPPQPKSRPSKQNASETVEAMAGYSGQCHDGGAP